jgi:hypothetical protein
MELIAVLMAVAGLFLWGRSESRNDIRAIQAEISGVKNELSAFRQEMHQEMRDFHGRLCSLEEKYGKEKKKGKE